MWASCFDFTVCVSDTYVWVECVCPGWQSPSTPGQLSALYGDANDSYLTFMIAFDFHSNPGRREGLIGVNGRS